jgi:ankyrin repeat protein
MPPSPEPGDVQEYALLVQALENEDPSYVQAVLDAGRDPNAPLGEDGATPLLLAARIGETSLVESLLARGADPARTDAEGWTALHWAVHENREAVVRVLLDHDTAAGVNTPDAAGTTPLMHAAEAGSENLARLLLERGADKDAVNQDGLSALTLAATGGHAGVLQILLDAGARVDMTDPHSRAALTWAAQRGHVTWATLLEKRDPASEEREP